MPDRSTDGIEFLDPTIRVAGEVMPAPRLSSLRGKQLGFLDNSKEKADVFMALAERLSQGFPLADLIHRQADIFAPGTTVAHGRVEQDLRRCDHRHGSLRFVHLVQCARCYRA